LVESRHRGFIAVVDASGAVVTSLGDIKTTAWFRSAAKPFQTIPIITSGAAARYGLTPRELAVITGSHSGERAHLETVLSILNKIALDESALKCGAHMPFDDASAKRLRAENIEPRALHNNCSGKHAGMLAVALHLGAPTENYESPENPVQLAIARVVSQFTGVAVEDFAVGIDGCAAPIFGVSVRTMALAYARLVSPPEDFDKATREACQRIVRVMTAYPQLIGGTSDRLDTEVMRAAPGRIVSKVGAEGVYTAGILPSERWPNGLGLAIKIEDGDDKRARPTVVVESLRQLGVLSDATLEAVARYAFFPVQNRRGDIVGEIRASFELRPHD
jgi:L-asparaginase II